MLAELEELVQNSNSEHANFVTVKQDILKLQRDNAEKIKPAGSITNEWMLQSLIKAYSSSSLKDAIGSKFARGQFS